jgi:hypothetical protein
MLKPRQTLHVFIVLILIAFSTTATLHVDDPDESNLNQSSLKTPPQYKLSPKSYGTNWFSTPIPPDGKKFVVSGEVQKDSFDLDTKYRLELKPTDGKYPLFERITVHVIDLSTQKGIERLLFNIDTLTSLDNFTLKYPIKHIQLLLTIYFNTPGDIDQDNCAASDSSISPVWYLNMNSEFGSVIQHTFISPCWVPSFIPANPSLINRPDLQRVNVQYDPVHRIEGYKLGRQIHYYGINLTQDDNLSRVRITIPTPSWFVDSHSKGYIYLGLKIQGLGFFTDFSVPNTSACFVNGVAVWALVAKSTTIALITIPPIDKTPKIKQDLLEIVCNTGNIAVLTAQEFTSPESHLSLFAAKEVDGIWEPDFKVGVAQFQLNQNLFYNPGYLPTIQGFPKVSPDFIQEVLPSSIVAQNNSTDSTQVSIFCEWFISFRGYTPPVPEGPINDLFVVKSPLIADETPYSVDYYFASRQNAWNNDRLDSDSYLVYSPVAENYALSPAVTYKMDPKGVRLSALIKGTKGGSTIGEYGGSLCHLEYHQAWGKEYFRAQTLTEATGSYDIIGSFEVELLNTTRPSFNFIKTQNKDVKPIAFSIFLTGPTIFDWEDNKSIGIKCYGLDGKKKKNGCEIVESAMGPQYLNFTISMNDGINIINMDTIGVKFRHVNDHTTFRPLIEDNIMSDDISFTNPSYVPIQTSIPSYNDRRKITLFKSQGNNLIVEDVSEAPTIITIGYNINSPSGWNRVNARDWCHITHRFHPSQPQTLPKTTEGNVVGTNSSGLDDDDDDILAGSFLTWVIMIAIAIVAVIMLFTAIAISFQGVKNSNLGSTNDSPLLDTTSPSHDGYN